MSNENSGLPNMVEIHAKNPLHAVVQIINQLALSPRDLIVLSTSLLAAVASTANKECPDSSPFLRVNMEESPTQIAIAVLNILEGLPCDCPACRAMREGAKAEEITPASDTKH